MSQAGAGREQQKQRTRAALLRTAREFLTEGREPTIQEVADRAGISRATTYRYYSSVEPLLQEAALDGIAERIDQACIAPGQGGGLAERVETTVTEILNMVFENEALFRAYLRNVAAPDAPRTRGARRIKWLNQAVGADGEDLPPELVERMTQALSLLSGIEAVIVARDVCGLDEVATRELFGWTARAIVKAALEEAARGAAVPPRG